LTDDKASMNDIKLMSNSTIYLKEACIEVDDDEEEGKTEFGFSGTKLHLSSRTRVEPKITNEPDFETDRTGSTAGSTPIQQGESEKHESQKGGMAVNDSDTTSAVDGQSNLPASPMVVDSRAFSEAPTPIPDPVNSCSVCTFINERGADMCEMCETFL
jgi:hypothetical protein